MNFIKEYFLDDLSICDQLIDLHKNSDKKVQGYSGGRIQPDIKKSTDMSFSPYDVNISNIDFVKKYFNNLQEIANEYIKEYYFCNKANPWQIVEGINIQHYKPNEGYFAWHFERGSNVMPKNNRHLTWMTYLNDLTDEGGTEFYYQNLKVNPQKGKTVIFPCDWTHTHRGVVSKTQDKYIITGWFNYVDRKES
jgi:prolyl 4-hydroxylase